jgi:lipopolysaccharide assembly protein A
MAQQGAHQGAGSRLRSIPARTWIALVLVIIAVVFILQNRDHIRIYIVNVQVSAPLWTVLLVTVLVGLLIGLMLHLRSRNR